MYQWRGNVQLSLLLFLWILGFWQHAYNFLYHLPNLSGDRAYFAVHEPVFSEQPIKFSVRNTAFASILYFSFFLKAKAFYLNYLTGQSEMQNEQYITETVVHWSSCKNLPWSLSLVFVDGFIYYVDELLPNDKKYQHPQLEAPFLLLQLAP